MNPNVSLHEATRALRATSGESHDAEGTRQRVLGTVAHRKRVRRQLIVGAATLLLGFPFGATAYAAFFGTPAFVQAWIDQLAPSVATSASTDTAAAPRARAKERVAVPGVSAVAPTSDPVMPAVPTPDAAPASTFEPTLVPVAAAEVAEPSTPRSRRPTATARTATSPAAAATSTTADAVAPALDANTLYARAHELHFATRNAQAALDAWDAYLAHVGDTPTAALLPEAQYNRALCLVRLHRNREALDALAPFASGAHGNYRRREATALTQALVRAASWRRR